MRILSRHTRAGSVRAVTGHVVVRCCAAAIAAVLTAAAYAAPAQLASLTALRTWTSRYRRARAWPGSWSTEGTLDTPTARVLSGLRKMRHRHRAARPRGGRGRPDRPRRHGTG